MISTGGSLGNKVNQDINILIDLHLIIVIECAGVDLCNRYSMGPGIYGRSSRAKSKDKVC